jgi:hypothetical protein
MTVKCNQCVSYNLIPIFAKLPDRAVSAFEALHRALIIPIRRTSRETAVASFVYSCNHSPLDSTLTTITSLAR